MELFRIAFAGSLLAALASLSACTVEEPLYCDKYKQCAPGMRCDYETRTCRPVDAALGEATVDGAQDLVGGDVVRDTPYTETSDFLMDIRAEGGVDDAALPTQ